MILENDFIDVAQIIAERKIAEAFERGEFNDLPGTGKPLHIDDDPFQSPGQRLVHKILKNAGLPPIEISLSRELAQLKTEVQRANSAEARCALLSDIPC